MPRFFTDPVGQGQDAVIIAGADAAHISRSLRMRPGEKLTVCDGRGTDYPCEISRMEREQVFLNILGSYPSPGESAVRVTLFQAVCKGDKLEGIVQKSVELGVDEIVPVLTGRCVARPDAQAWERRRARLSRIALEAAKQCGRGRIPPVRPLLPFGQLPEALGGYGRALLFYERAVARLNSVPLAGVRTLAVVVGAEGGFAEEEADALCRAGARPVSLGSRILRCETAPVAALAAILYAVGEM